MTDTPVSAKDRTNQRILLRRFLTPGGNGIAIPVTLAAGNVVVTLPRSELDTNYGVVATPNWGTTCYVTAKAVTGFTINFGTVAPANATVDYLTFRSE